MSWEVRHGDALTVMATLDAKSVDLIVTDPPYFRVKDEAWDRQWKTKREFLGWIDALGEQFQRVLKPNGSLYLFASPEMAAHVEVTVGERFNVLNNIRWIKKEGWHHKAKKDELRTYLTPSESIIFAEPFWSDDEANITAGYEAACDALHKKVYAPIGAYLRQERERAGVTRNEVEVALGFVSSSDPTRGTALCYRWEEGSSLPTRTDYYRLRDFLNTKGDEYLRKEYEDLRRPFTLSAKVPFTDVWDFPTVAASPYKHVCEKPLALLSHMIRCSSRSGALVLDCFAGSGSTGVAALRCGRSFLGIEQDERWVANARQWIDADSRQGQLFAVEQAA